MKTLKIRIRGNKPLLQHNEQLANPLLKASRDLAEITKKRSKTLDDHQLIAKLEFAGGIYCDEKIGPYVPHTQLLRCIENGAKKEKLGKTMRSALSILTEKIPIVYDGPRVPQKLYEVGFYDQRCVGVNQAKTVRTRPRFNEWELAFELEYDETQVDEINVRRAIEHAGKVEGIGDYRPRYGTFTLVSFDAA